MKRGLIVLACAAVLAAGATAATDRLLIDDHGQRRSFEIATDELHAVTPAREHRAEKFAPLPDVKTVRQHAAARQRATGDQYELVLYETGRPRNEFTRRILTRHVVVQLAADADPRALAAAVGAVCCDSPLYAPGCHIFETKEPGGALDLATALQGRPGVLYAEPLLARQARKKFIPNDTYFTNQWHLLNTGQGGGTAGIHVNITNVWESYRGSNVVIAIVDDGLQRTHPDLASNYVAALSWDFNYNDPDPSPDVKYDDHGTSCAGVAAARGHNGIGVTGAAFESPVAGLRLIALAASDAQEAAALSFSNAAIFVKSNSWGPDDDGRTLEGPGMLTATALSNAVVNGRGGKGVIFTWAGGNGLSVNDNANYDGYANSIYTIAACAVSDQGLQASYSEPGACLLVAAPSSSSGRQSITTTDLTGKTGYNSTSTTDYSDRDYTKTFGGTSSATPLVAGVCALILQANPNLGWRDVQEILIRSATKNAPSDADWATNSAGFHFNHKFGAGLLNAGAAVTLGTNWTNLSSQQLLTVSQTGLALPIPDNNSNGVVRTFDFSAANFRVEHVTVTVNITHTYRGDLVITLTSPSGMTSRLTEKHSDPGDNYSDWKLMSVRHWGESAAGTWTVKIADVTAVDTGRVNSVRVDLHGTRANSPPQVTSAEVLPAQPNTLSNLTVSATASDDDGDPVTLAYQWQEAGTNNAHIAVTLPATATKAGENYRCVITPHDGFTNGTPFTTASVLVSADSDGDGLNDDWEVAYFGNLAATGSKDADGDGMTNLQEYLAGTSPTNPRNVLSIIQADVSGNDFTISFPSVSGKYYDVERNDILTNPAGWTPIQTNIPGNGAAIQITDPGAAALPQRFYRVRLVPSP